MPSRKTGASFIRGPQAWRWIVLMALVLPFILCFQANISTMTERSLIPMQIHAVVAEKRILHEKHPGQDDVHLLVLQDPAHSEIRVDRDIFRQIDSGARLEKEAGGRTLSVGGRPVKLEISADARGMRKTMLLSVLLIAAWAVVCGMVEGRSNTALRTGPGA